MNTPQPPARLSRRHSLRWRLPFLISCLVTVVLTTFLWAAYHSVQATLIQTAGERAQRAADLVASLLDGQRTIQQLGQLAADARLRQFLETRSDDDREAARARLAALTRASARHIELWDAAGSRLLVVSSAESESLGGAPLPRMPPLASGPPVLGIGPLKAEGGIVFTDTVGAIAPRHPDRPGEVLGYVRVRSTFTESPPGIFGRLVGPEAVVRVANRSGGLWTDFLRVTPALPVDLARPGSAQYRDGTGVTRLGAVAPISGTPWSAWVEFPLASVLAPSRNFLTGMISITLMFVAAAAALSTALAHRITGPLSEISAAAAAFAVGEYARPVTTTRRDEIGQLGRTFNAMVTGITAATGALRRSEDNYRRLFASNPHPMWVYDLETLRFVDVNDMAVAHYGYSRDEFLAMTIKDLRPSDDVPALLANLQSSASPASLSGVWRHLRRDGSVIDVEVSSHALVLDGRQTRVVLGHDVTERLRAQRALEASESLFRGMAEAMPHIVWTAQPDGRATYHNHRWMDYTGLSLANMAAGAAWQLVVHPDDLQETLDRWNEALETGGAYKVTHRLKRADGAYRWHTGRAAPLTNENGAILIWVGTITDIDDARRDQEALEALNAELEERVQARTAQLEAANQELESFSYSVSHDLRAPLRHVQGYVEMVTVAAEGQLSEQVQRYLRTITDATLEMGQLIDDLLAFSRMARVHMSEGAVSLEALVQDTLVGLEPATRGRRIRWQSGSLPTVIGDPSMLKQVYVNLLHNAIKYTRQRDPAEIEIGCAGEDDGQHVLFVRDNGAGFDMQYAHKLFGVFQRLHRSDEFEGTGIGLATVRRIVTRHGGRTWAEGAVDKGATVYFTLPPRDA